MKKAAGVCAFLCCVSACGEGSTQETRRTAALSSRLCGPDCEPEVLASEQSYPVAIKVDGNRMFWGNYGDFDYAIWYSGSEGAIYVAPKNGGTPELVKDGIVGLTDIAVHGQDVYWTAFGTMPYVPDVGDGEVGYGIVQRRHSVRNARTGVFSSATPLVDTLGPSIGSGTLYFADYGANAIMSVRIPARTTGAVTVQPSQSWEATVMFANAGVPMHTAADESHVAWTSSASGEVWISRQGREPERAATGQTNAITAPHGVALRGQYVYWIRTNYPGLEGQPGYLLRTQKEAPTGGTRTVTTLAVADLHASEALAVDNDFVYWITIDLTGYGGQLLRTPVSGGETILLKGGLSFPVSIAIDEDSVYVAECGINFRTGRILRFEKYRRR